MGRWGPKAEKAVYASVHVVRMGQGSPFKAMSAFQEPTKGPSSLDQLQVNPLNLG